MMKHILSLIPGLLIAMMAFTTVGCEEVDSRFEDTYLAVDLDESYKVISGIGTPQIEKMTMSFTTDHCETFWTLMIQHEDGVVSENGHICFTNQGFDLIPDGKLDAAYTGKFTQGRDELIIKVPYEGGEYVISFGVRVISTGVETFPNS
ncbi:MAG: hypothetical protein AAFY71_11360 [Bacteroidota bacterium]